MSPIKSPKVGGKTRRIRNTPPPAKVYPVTLDCPKCGYEWPTTCPAGITDVWTVCNGCGKMVSVTVTMRPDGHGTTETVI